MKPSALLALALALAVPSFAQPFGMSEELGAAVMSSRRLAASAPQAIAALQAAAAASPVAQKAVAPVNTGFQALGAAGKTGQVQGPPGGDGTYKVWQNDANQMVFDMRTGYVAGRFTIKRDPATGKDLLGFEGSTKDGPFSGWTPAKGIYTGQITYNPGSDSGTVIWQLNGETIRDTYKNGRAGSRSMTITLKGHEHTFTQD
ncbi:MAG TPA: hypothetical protein VN915_11235 [Elusimicrobiota bacterium]|nr:hypothetical protein [Elusimicrobiota bacterium]